MATLVGTIEQRLAERADAAALFWEHEVFSFQTLDAWSRALAGDLARRGIRPGERVAVGLPNSPMLVATILAVMRYGTVLVPINPAAPATEAVYIVKDSDATLIISREEQARELSRSFGGSVIPELERHDLPLPKRETAPEDPALIVYTSGTTARPKGAVLSQRALLSNLTTVAQVWKWTETDRLLLVLPCFHLHGLGLGILCSLLVGSSIVLRPRFVASETPSLLARHACTMFFGVPTIYNRLVALREDSLSEADLSSVRLWVSGSAPLTATTFERFRETFGYELMNRYGMTEVGFVIGTRLDERRRPGAIGRPFPGIQIRIVDPDRADEDELSDVHDGQVGEIVINGPNLFSGYWQKPEETKKAFLKGFVRSGDLAEREADGMIRIVGRRSVDIIKTRGFKISAVEIENCLQQHPSVMEVTVVGVPDPDLGEAVVAAVSAKPGSAVTPEAIQSYARAHLAPHKVPARVVLMTEIPRSGPGKFNKRELVDRLLAGV